MPRTLGCPNCTGGTVQVAWMTGDGQPGVPVEVSTDERECDLCDGTGKIEESALAAGAE